jgi:hypothetical protein
MTQGMRCDEAHMSEGHVSTRPNGKTIEPAEAAPVCVDVLSAPAQFCGDFWGITALIMHWWNATARRPRANDGLSRSRGNKRHAAADSRREKAAVAPDRRARSAGIDDFHGDSPSSTRSSDRKWRGGGWVDRGADSFKSYR